MQASSQRSPGSIGWLWRRASDCCLSPQVAERVLNTLFDVRIGHNQHAAFVPRHQHDFLRHACVQLVQGLNHVAPVEDWGPLFCGLMEHKVPEQLQ